MRVCAQGKGMTVVQHREAFIDVGAFGKCLLVKARQTTAKEISIRVRARGDALAQMCALATLVDVDARSVVVPSVALVTRAAETADSVGAFCDHASSVAEWREERFLAERLVEDLEVSNATPCNESDLEEVGIIEGCWIPLQWDCTSFHAVLEDLCFVSDCNDYCDCKPLVRRHALLTLCEPHCVPLCEAEGTHENPVVSHFHCPDASFACMGCIPETDVNTPLEFHREGYCDPSCGGEIVQGDTKLQRRTGFHEVLRAVSDLL
mmetsp:Transcript_48597/g.99210  ORF Transcript_48597/g.99210 Transcript_48597/m.99210 type:complete len:264 (-) Transcript_48597:200-991(-)